MIECTHLFLFGGGGDDGVLDILGHCNTAHAKRTLHIKYPGNISSAMVYGIPKINKQLCILQFIQLQCQNEMW